MLESTTPLGGYDRDFGDVHLAEVTGLALVSVAVPLGGDADQIATKLGVAAPAPGQFTSAGDQQLIWMSPDQMMLAFPSDAPLAEPQIQAKLAGAAYTTNQTDAWAVLSLSGVGVDRALERICPLDLAGLKPGSAARTVMEHMGVVILRSEDATVLMSAASSGLSFLHAVEKSVEYTQNG